VKVGVGEGVIDGVERTGNLGCERLDELGEGRVPMVLAPGEHEVLEGGGAIRTLA
jgi:hypothetical protein